MDFWNFIGFTASILGAATFVPEVIKALKTRHLRDLAWGMLFLIVSSSVLWLIFGIQFQIYPLILSSSINIVLAAILIFLKILYRKNGRFLKMR